MTDAHAAEVFTRVAQQFCELVEQLPSDANDEFLTRLSIALAELIAAGLSLPDVAPPTATIPTNPQIDHAADVVRDKLRLIVGDRDLYWTVDPKTKEAPVRASLSDDLADVYRDLQEGLMMQEKGAEPAEILWTWRFSFDSHWGRHATDALRFSWTELSAF